LFALNYGCPLPQNKKVVGTSTRLGGVQPIALCFGVVLLRFSASSFILLSFKTVSLLNTAHFSSLFD